MSKYLIDRYRRELESYTFSEEKYDQLINGEPQREVFNESFNRSVLMNTPKEIYLNGTNFIYYDSLREINNNINEWIEIFSMQTKFADNNIDIYLYFVSTLKRIRTEIQNFARRCSNKYNLRFTNSDFFSDTLVKVYIDILWERRLQINNELRKILSFYCNDYTNKLLELYHIYGTMILSEEEEKPELYDQFRKEIETLNKPMLLIKEREGLK